MNEWLDTWLAAPVGDINAADALLHLACSFVLGQLVAWVYVWTHHGMSYSRAQVQSLVLLSLIVTLVMLAIGNNLAGAFGLFGALALIRFRTPIKDARDTAFLFLAVAVGIAVGTRNLALAAVGTVFALLIALYLAASRFGERIDSDGVLRFRLDDGGGDEAPLRRVLAHYCRSFALLQLRETGTGAGVEFAYQLRLRDVDQSSVLLEDVRSLPGVGSVSLLMHGRTEEP